MTWGGHVTVERPGQQERVTWGYHGGVNGTSHHGGSHHMGPPRQVVTLTHTGDDGNSLNLPGGDGVWEQH